MLASWLSGQVLPWLYSGPMGRTWQGPGGVFCSRPHALGKLGCVGPVPAVLADPCLTLQDAVTCAHLRSGVYKVSPCQTFHVFNTTEAWGVVVVWSPATEPEQKPGVGGQFTLLMASGQFWVSRQKAECLGYVLAPLPFREPSRLFPV